MVEPAFLSKEHYPLTIPGTLFPHQIKSTQTLQVSDYGEVMRSVKCPTSVLNSLLDECYYSDPYGKILEDSAVERELE